MGETTTLMLSYSLENEGNNNLPVARVITPKLFLVLPMFLHGPFYHSNHAHHEEQNAYSNGSLAHAHVGGSFLQVQLPVMMAKATQPRSSKK